MFVDYIKIRLRAGSGGDGSRSFRRAKFVPDGGPDGGDGGRGGDVYFMVDNHQNTLGNFRYNRLYEAENGRNGQGSNMTGKSGDDLIVRVPQGTVILDEEGHVIQDIIEEDKKYLILKGGKGGLGNVHFKSSVRQAPNFAIGGEKKEEITVILELRMIADVGLLGFPNAGKSTFLSTVTKARPKIADYPFTTITPNLGVATDDYNRQFVIADIPGIIEGASEGVGLGLKFLKHVERCRILLHLVDSTGLEGDPVERFKILNEEVKKFSKKTGAKKQIMCITKIDAGNTENIEKLKKEAEKEGIIAFEISSVTGKGVREVINYLAEELQNIPKEEIKIEKVFKLESNDDSLDYNIYVTTERKEKIYNIEGKAVEKLLNRVNVADRESMHYFHQKLRDLGIEKKLKEMGIQEGDTVNILDWYFEWYE